MPRFTQWPRLEVLKTLQASFMDASSVGSDQIKAIQSSVVKTITTAANAFYQQGLFDLAKALTELCCGYWQVVDNQHFDMARLLNTLGSIALRQGNPRQALSWLDQANALYEKLNPETAGMADVCNNRGNAYRKLGDYIEAHRVFDQALAFADYPQKQRLLANKATCYRDQQQPEKALQCLLRRMTNIRDYCHHNQKKPKPSS